ncbi:MAG: thiamine ABC transporter substrate-binding protein, partial [Pseudomonadota bacterium]
LQIEIAGRLAASDQPELATAFLDFMLGEAFQAAIPTTNWMFPAVTPAAGLPEGFPAAPETARHFDAEAAREAREAALAAWLAAFSG